MRAPRPIPAEMIAFWMACALVLFLAGEFAQAQPAARPPKEPPKFELSAGSLAVGELPPLFWLEESPGGAGEKQKRWVRLEVPEGSRGSPVAVPVASARLFTGDPEAPGGAKMTPYLEIPAKAGGRLFLLFHLDEKGAPKHTFLEDADGTHAAGSVRVVNLTGRRVAVSLGGQPSAVGAGERLTLKPVLDGNGRFEFRHFEEVAGGRPYESPMKRLRFPREGMRLLVVFVPMPLPPELDADGRPLGPVVYATEAIRLYDRQPGYQQATVRPSPPPADRVLEVLALGTKWTSGKLEIQPPHGESPIHVDLKPGESAAVRLPVAGAATLGLRMGGEFLGTVNLGVATASAFLALAPPAAPGDPATAGLYESSEQSHPQGKLRIFNLTPYQMACSVGSKPLYLNPKGSAVFETVTPNAPLPLKIAVQVEGAWKAVEHPVRRSPAPEKRPGLFVYPSGTGTFTVLEKTL